MSDFERLKAMLRHSAQDGTPRLGRVEYATAQAGVARVLEQVDTAVIGQQLSFEFDDGARLVCTTVGRRLVRLLPPAPPGLTAEQTALFDLDELRGEHAQGLSNLLVGLCERGAGFAMRVEPLGEGVAPASGGVEPVAIAEAAGLPGEAMFETGAGKLHETFLDALQASLRAAILIDGEVSSLICGEGDEAALVVDWVESSLEKLLSPGFPLLGTLETNGILVFGLPEAAGCHLLIAGRRGNLVVATVKGGDVAATVDLWRKHCQTNSA
ncbi:hypothetical protein DEA8626_01767 [Defluviimonas aquaemixtae]|uniref:Uncharacterized protein n=1 Tax=Albidovulum aquaemixtae TaxID=1542388 RepID=A0A2R8B6G9_9RHOB|nr:hypothetical protein [Defluviimonas aquaemixtae]SPH18235.1 hypothetical protein DEA8626_01767 [Defluviimonas aquaemixtae]